MVGVKLWLPTSDVSIILSRSRPEVSFENLLHKHSGDRGATEKLLVTATKSNKHLLGAVLRVGRALSNARVANALQAGLARDLAPPF